MTRFKMMMMAAGAAAILGLSLPAAAQLTYNFSNTGNCNFPPATCNVTPANATQANNLTLSAWGAASAAGSTFALATITDQNGSGIGVNSDGNTAPNHAVDNVGRLEVVLLNFAGNNVVLNSVTSGWSQQDTDISILRWTGAASGPTMTTTSNFANMTSAQLTAAGWQLVKSADLDSNQNAANTYATTYGSLSTTTGLGATTSNASSWWIVSAYFGSNSGALTAGDDYFKLQAVNATCVGNTTGQSCNTAPRPMPEPGSLALAGLALIGLVAARRKGRTVRA